MAHKNSLFPGARRIAAGIDVGPREVRLVVLSQRTRGNAPVRIEYVATVPLHPGAMAGVEIVDRAAITNAMREAFARLPHECPAQACRCAMAMPAAATFMSTLPVAQFAELRDRNPHAPGVLEPAAMAEAERIAGMERHTLAVDWFIDDSHGGAGRLTVATTSRQHLEARVECAAEAGIMLTAVDGEPSSALRAMRHAASFLPEPHEPYVVLWIGGDGVYGWRIVDDVVAADMRYPAPEHADLAEALRDLADECALNRAPIGGEVGLLDGVEFSVADIGDVLGCAVLPFACALQGEPLRPLADELLHDPAFAVACGLALRGVME